MSQACKKFLPLFDRVLVERLVPEVRSKGGIMLPEKARGKMTEAKVVAVGPGAPGDGGATVPPAAKVGDKVLLPEFGGTKVVIEDKEYYLYRDSDLLGKFQA